MAEPEAPPFDAIWSRAERRYQAGRRRYAWVAAAAAAVAALIVVTNGLTPAPQQSTYIEMAELLDSTSWSAPSDVLLPEYQFDIYEELPTLTLSTKTAEGALL